jgi:hypothetical protein
VLFSNVVVYDPSVWERNMKYGDETCLRKIFEKASVVKFKLLTSLPCLFKIRLPLLFRQYFYCLHRATCIDFVIDSLVPYSFALTKRNVVWSEDYVFVFVGNKGMSQPKLSSYFASGPIVFDVQMRRVPTELNCLGAGRSIILLQWLNIQYCSCSDTPDFCRSRLHFCCHDNRLQHSTCSATRAVW